MNEIENEQLPVEPSISGLAKPIVKELAPYGIKFIKVLVMGKKIMICGPSNAGKSHFKLFFLNDLFLPAVSEQERESTYDFESEKYKLIKYGKNKNQYFWLKSFIDSPGEIPPKYQVRRLEAFKPKGLIIYLNCEDFERNKRNCNSTKWLKLFYSYLRNTLQRNIKLNKSLKLIIIILNKYDKINKTNYKNFKEIVNKMTFEYLDQCYIQFYYKNRNIPILPCISVENKEGDKYLVSIINNIISRIK